LEESAELTKDEEEGMRLNEARADTFDKIVGIPCRISPTNQALSQNASESAAVLISDEALPSTMDS
jgi:hypothetical protein